MCRKGRINYCKISDDDYGDHGDGDNRSNWTERSVLAPNR